MTFWLRHRELCTVWCAIASVSDHHAATCCRGSIVITDAYQFDVHANPPHDDRCSACCSALFADSVVEALRPAARPFETFDYSDVEDGRE